jgi:hypothetical protein
MSTTKKNINNNTNTETTPEKLLEFTSNLTEITKKYSYEQEKIENTIHLEATIHKLIYKFSLLQETEYDHAAIGMCCLLQSGSYLKSVTNRTIKIGGTTFTKKNLIFASEQIENTYTLRYIARYMKKTIAKIALHYKIPGHLYSRFKIENATLIASNTEEQNRELATYCTDFQIENTETPEIIIEYLANREKNRTSK